MAILNDKDTTATFYLSLTHFKKHLSKGERLKNSIKSTVYHHWCSSQGVNLKVVTSTWNEREKRQILSGVGVCVRACVFSKEKWQIKNKHTRKRSGWELLSNNSEPLSPNRKSHKRCHFFVWPQTSLSSFFGLLLQHDINLFLWPTVSWRGPLQTAAPPAKVGKWSGTEVKTVRKHCMQSLFYKWKGNGCSWDGPISKLWKQCHT